MFDYEIPEEIAARIEERSISLDWDRNDSLNNKQVSQLLAGDITLDDIAEDILTSNHNWEYEATKWEVMDMLKDAFSAGEIEDPDGGDYFDKGAWWDAWERQWSGEFYPSVDIDMQRLADMTHAYIGVNLHLSHDHASGDSYDPEDFADEFEVFQIDPAAMTEFIEFDYQPEAVPGRVGTEIVDPEDLATAWANCFYPGSYTVMLTGFEVGKLISELEAIKTRGMIVKAGTRVVIHDYLNGASALDVKLIRDWAIPADMICEIYNDSDSRYGIQACCDYCGDAWEGAWEVPEAITETSI